MEKKDKELNKTQAGFFSWDNLVFGLQFKTTNIYCFTKHKTNTNTNIEEPAFGELFIVNYIVNRHDIYKYLTMQIMLEKIQDVSLVSRKGFFFFMAPSAQQICTNIQMQRCMVIDTNTNTK